ncbi:hypothetical protein NC99_46140 [Sunxiuqinia dokdonensis]|uniref:Uncharacterized protein n=1 Tax=Sunxiuqinia dokdonensis TaxID=1409788 RepID=A0A0L8V2E1_9BACT|nr:hypothetical protein NC99_46140 [Sunxiuqinia dokdonensis]
MLCILFGLKVSSSLPFFYLLPIRNWDSTKKGKETEGCLHEIDFGCQEIESACTFSKISSTNQT